MKLTTKVNDAIVANVETQGGFRIKNSAKAFQILSSGLYSNKIKAVVRELSCNACDSHTEANKSDVPFDVHLPNNLEPYFSVRDYGIGLDHEGVTQIYTTYFESTKQDSNDYIGALGLGSKSPFSYTENFTVIAIKDGVSRIYTAYIDGSGCPAIALMSTSPTNEINGVEVKFSVTDGYDCRRFRDEAESVYQWFETKPNVTGSSHYTDRSIGGLGDEISKGVYYTASVSSAYAVQGNIAYRIELPDVDDDYIKSLMRASLVMHFDIGELDISASRESLSYDDDTVAAIIDRMSGMKADVYTYVVGKLSNIENAWEKAWATRELHRISLFAGAVTEYVANGNVSLLCIPRSGIEWDYRQISLSPVDLTERGIKMRCYRVNASWSGCKLTERYAKDIDIGDNSRRMHTVPTGKDTIYIIQDTKRGAITRIREHFKVRDRNCYHIVFIEISKGTNRARALYKFFKSLKNPPNTIMNVSELLEPAPPAPRRTKMLKLVRDYSYYNDAEWKWQKDDFEEEEDGSVKYYVAMRNTTVLTCDGGKEWSEFLDTWTYYRNSGLLGSTATVHGVRKSQIAAIKDNPNWRNLHDVMETEFAKADTKRISAYLQRAAVSWSIINKDSISRFTELSDDSIFKKYVDSMKCAYTDDNGANTLQYIIDAMSAYDMKQKISEERAEKLEEYKAMLVNYPMLRLLDSEYYNRLDEIIEYIILVDETRSKDNE